MPSYREDEEALDTSDIRKILLACNNRRLKTLHIITTINVNNTFIKSINALLYMRSYNRGVAA